MTEYVPDWASQPANVPQSTTDDQAPSWATASGGAPAWASGVSSTDTSKIAIPAGAKKGVTAEGIKQGGIITDPDPGIGGVLKRVGQTMHDEMGGAFEGWFGGWGARTLDKATGYAATPWATSKLDPEFVKNYPAQAKALQADYERKDAIAKRREYAQGVAANSQGFNPAGFAAGIAGSADPTWAINPGAALTKGLMVKGAEKAVANVVANTAAHAAMGSASDAAYQIADDIDGIKKGFDIKRNLENAVVQGMFGGAHATVTEVAPFVVDLFKNRGVDTLPPDRPAGATRPLSGQGLTPEQTAQYHEVLKTGDVNDIRDFFKDKNTAPPSFENAHRWVTYRDGVPEGYAQEEFHPLSDDQEFHRQAVEDHIGQHTKDWTNAPEVNVVHSPGHIEDSALRDRVTAQDPNGDALGMYDAETGKVHIFSDRIHDEDTANAVLFHESLGHYGLAQKFGDKLDSTLQTLVDRNVGQFGKDVEAWQKENPNAYGGDKLRAAEEVLANKSNEGVLKPSIMDAVSAGVRDYGRKLGLDLKYSDNEIKTILAMAHDAVVNGKGRDVASNGFRFSKQEDSNDRKTKAFTDLANAQRDKPEHAMLQAQSDVSKYQSGNTYGTVLEHVGDLTHRMSEPYAQQARDHGLEYVAPKVERAIAALENPVDRERLEQGKPWQEPSVQRYADEHAKLPVYNETQRAGRDAAIKLGKGDIDGSLYELKSLKRTIDSGKYPEEAAKYDPRYNRFMRKSDLASEKDYQVKAIKEAYDALDTNYEPTAVNWKETERAAVEAGFTPSQIKDLRETNPGELGKKAWRLKAAVNMLDQKMAILHAKFDSGDFSINDKIEYTKAAVDHAYFLQRIRDDRAEAARTLNLAKAIGYTKGDIEGFKAALEESGGLQGLSDDETFIRWLKQNKALMASGNGAGARASMVGVTKPYWEQYLLSYRHNMMLSGVSTHVKNFVDNGTMLARELEEKVATLPLSAARSVINSLGGDVKPGVHPGEVGSHIAGLLRAATDAQTWMDTARAFRDGPTPAQTSKNANMADARIPVISKVGDALHAADIFYRSFLTNANLYSLGARKVVEDAHANGTKITLDDVMVGASNHALMPTPDMLKEAKGLTDQALLVNSSPLTAGFEKLKNYRPGMTRTERAKAFFANIMFPFIRVGANAIQNQIIRRSPLAPILDRVTQEDWAAGGARRDIAIMRIMFGTATIANAWIAGSAVKDKMTGARPANAAKAMALQSAGVVPQAVHEDGKYKIANSLNISVNPLDLHNATATMVAGARQAYDLGKADAGQTATAVKLAFLSVLHTLAGQSIINNLTPLVEAFDAKDSEGSKLDAFLGGEARTMLPNLSNQTAHILDPNLHDTNADGTTLGKIGATIQSNIPINPITDRLNIIPNSKGLPIRYGVYGEPLKTGTTMAGVHVPGISDGNHQDEPTDPTIKELARLEKLTPAAVVTPVQRTINVPEVGKVKLNSDQFEEYQMYSGRGVVSGVKELIDSGEWQQMSDRDKVAEIKSIQKDVKSTVREALLAKEGWLKPSQLDSLRRQQLNGQ